MMVKFMMKGVALVTVIVLMQYYLNHATSTATSIQKKARSHGLDPVDSQ